MTYTEAMAFIDSTKYLGSKLGLNSITELMHELKDVQDLIRVVHITGTNGKGSVGAILSSVLVESGYKVGRFDSPAVFSYEEVFLMNGQPIEKQRLADILEEVKAACERMVKRGCDHPTSFEIETAAAFLWFYQEKADVVLLEVGMGGATDSTNVIAHPDVCVFTPISMDHMQLLGDSLGAIATVKAGIIKPGCEAVTAVQPMEAMNVIERIAEEKGVCLHKADGQRLSLVEMTPKGIRFQWRSEHACGTQEYFLGVSGMYQLENAACALETLQVLGKRFTGITQESIKKGLAGVKWPGRFEQIGEHPQFFLDGAHNTAAAIQLRNTLDYCFGTHKVTYLMGVLADKEYKKIIDIMLKQGDHVYCMTPPNPRALSAADLAEYLRGLQICARDCENVETAVRKSVQDAGKDGIIVAFGSLYYLHQIRMEYEKIYKKENE